MVQRQPVKRILLKMSGEILLGSQSYGIDVEACKSLSQILKAIVDSGIQVGLVLGGGNIFRGINLEKAGIERTPADHMGMLATLMNGVALEQTLQHLGCPAVALSALPCPTVMKSYTWPKALKHLAKGDVVIFAGGTGNPYFTTDTAAALRASEIKADLFVKATKVDGVFDKDPMRFPDAKKFDTLTYSEALAANVGVMDATAIVMCRNAHVPIFVFDMARLKQENFNEILARKNQKGTLIVHNA